MHADLERIVSEDETARAAVESAASTARARIDAARRDLARLRDERLRDLRHELDETIAAILAEADRDVAGRQALREAHRCENAARAAALVDAAANAWVEIVREGPSKGSP